jgi:hypothetical protein
LPFIAYLDEFGHIGPYISRSDVRHNDSPVFGLAGLVLPATQVRGFGTWFYHRKCELLDWEINRAGEHPAVWEKKGAALYTVKNVQMYRELRAFTNRLLNRIGGCGGFVFYVGVRKTQAPSQHRPNDLYRAVLREAIKRLNQFCLEDCAPPESFILVMDEHDQRATFITEAAKAMYNPLDPRRALIEPPFQVESHRYQTLQAADWIAGLVGRLGAAWTDPSSFPENDIFRLYFESRLNEQCRRSGIRSG